MSSEPTAVALSHPVYPSSSMTDGQWAIIEPLLPPPGNTTGQGGRPEKHCRRRIVDAIFYVVGGGVAWRQLPHDFPPAMTVYDTYRRWVRSGAWLQLHDALRDQVRVHSGRNALPTAAIIDSPSVRGADTVPTGSRGYDAGNHAGWVVMPGRVVGSWFRLGWWG